MLAKKYRLISEKDFNQVHQGGKNFKGTFLYLKAKSSSYDFPRFGFLISNRLSKKSSVRNLIKRRARAVIRQLLSKIKPEDIVIGCFRLPTPLPLSQTIKKEIIFLLTKANLLNQ